MRVRSGDFSLLDVCELLVGLLFGVLVLSRMLGFLPRFDARWVYGAVRTWEVTAGGRIAASAGAAGGVVVGGALAGVCLVSSRVSKAWCKAVLERGGRWALLLIFFLMIGEESSVSLSLG